MAPHGQGALGCVVVAAVDNGLVVENYPNNCGGISEWMKIAAMASAHHLQMAPHGQGALGCVVVAAVDNGLVVENYLRNFSTDMVGDLEFKDGHVIMDDAPWSINKVLSTGNQHHDHPED